MHHRPLLSALVLALTVAIAGAAGVGAVEPEPVAATGVDTSLKAGRAGVCQIGPGLASTLLFPYFEVDLDNPNGVTTLLSINNGLSAPVLTRVVMWTDWGVPTLAFDLYLDTFDVQSINVRLLFNGEIPSTGEGDDLSGFPFCGSIPPSHANPALTSGEIEQLRTAHTGQAGHIDGMCYGASYGDNFARGFITVDVVDECSGVEGHQPTFTPANTSYPYFADGGASSGIAIVNNTLWGDIVYVDYLNNFAQGSEAVALWADPGEFTGSDVFTFYGRHSDYDGRDERVPLPRRWDQRFFNGGAFSGGATIIAFQQPNHDASSPVACGTAPPWWPLENTVGTLDEEGENHENHANDLFGLVTQRVSIGTVNPSYSFGWIQISASDRQLWVQPTLAALGRFSASFNGFPVEFLCGQNPPTN